MKSQQIQGEASMKQGESSQVSLIGLIAIAGMTGVLFTLTESGKPQFGTPHSISGALEAIPPTFTLALSGKDHFARPESVSAALDALPPTAAGRPSALAPAPAEAQRPGAYLGGAIATGRVAEVYIRAADKTFLALERAPAHLRDSAERWVDVQFPELLADGTGTARAVLDRSDLRIAVGDVVEIRFAHKDNPRYFPVKELTRVTELVASKDQMLAREFERRILARSGNGNPRAQWLSQLPATEPATGQSIQTPAASAAR
jgi:hypothetical protein